MSSIERILDIDIRPYLRSHGGDIQFISYDIKKSELNLKLMGQCCCCPNSIETIDNYIKIKIKEKFPQLIKINVLTGVTDDLWEIAKKYLRR